MLVSDLVSLEISKQSGRKPMGSSAETLWLFRLVGAAVTIPVLLPAFLEFQEGLFRDFWIYSTQTLREGLSRAPVPQWKSLRGAP
ncbi:MAG: hypothetical protein UY66_C0013G0004 [Parcubacteria group bacterium GW2011_GWC1_51_35]|nr:MAG: hypothetical protein UY66_C0013G0004 [Parcubacteria group bacterium GW2011_GWC1_51_35]